MTKIERTNDYEYLIETKIGRSRIKRNKKKDKKVRFTGKFYVIVAIIVMAFFSFIAPVMG